MGSDTSMTPEPLAAASGHADEAAYESGLLALQGGDAEQAEIWFREALDRDPDHTAARLALARSLRARKEYKLALSHVRAIVNREPRHVDALLLAGQILSEGFGKLALAERSFRSALRLRPDASTLHVHLGNALFLQGKLDEAGSSYSEAVRLNPTDVDALTNLGAVKQARLDIRGAIRCYTESLSLNPFHATSHWNLATALLISGEWVEGWKEFEWRPVTGDEPVRNFHAGDFRSFDLPGKHVLVRAEHGLGDTLQFVRYLPLLKSQGCEVTFECQAGLEQLLRGSGLADQVLPRVPGASPAGAYDACIPLLSLPLLFGTIPETVPRQVPYLRVDPRMAEQWRDRTAKPGLLRIGVSWRGNPNHPDDRNRSCPAEFFGLLASVAGVQLFVLQKDPRPDELQLLSAQGTVVDCSGEVREWPPTAAAVSQLDLVITVDTAIAHLAGALGKEVWTLLSYVPDWRWLLDRSDTPWYPTMRLFRQKKAGAWGELFEEVVALLRSRVSPSEQSNPSVLLEDGAALHRCGRLSEAMAIYRRLLAAEPGHADALHLLGLALHQEGSDEEAYACVREAVGANPFVAEYQNTIGVVAKSLGRNVEAEEWYRRSLRTRPSYAEAANNLGVLMQESGRIDEAAACFGAALASKPDNVDAMYNLAGILHRQGDLDASAAKYRMALSLNPESPEIRAGLGRTLWELGNNEEALRLYREALTRSPDNPSLSMELAALLVECGSLTEAFHRAGALLSNPDTVVRTSAMLTLGNILKEEGDLDGALARFQEALSVDPRCSTALNNLAGVYLAMGNVAESMNAYDRAIALRPDDADARFNRSMVCLLIGEYREGWREYEWRLKTGRAHHRFNMRRTAKPHWDGGSLDGKTILVTHEQGYGDSLQMVRYLPLLKDLGAQVLLECHDPLLRLLRGAPGVDGAGDRRSIPDASFDVHASLMSLPALLGTLVETIPSAVPYLAPPDAVDAEWAGRIGPGIELRVGLVWRGSPRHRNDRNRSCAAADFAELVAVEGVRWCILQQDATAEEIRLLSSRGRVVDCSPWLSDFAETAAAIMHLDLVITVDTAVAHLAGALGKEVWTLLPAVPDWRWMLDRADTPWYPTMKLIRQKTAGDWSTTLLEARMLLSARIPGDAELDVQAAITEGISHLRAGDLENAERTYRRVLSVEPNQAAALHLLGVVLHQRGAEQEAYDAVRQSIGSDPFAAEYQHTLGMIAKAMGNAAEAEEWYRKALRLNPAYAEAANNLGVLFLEGGRLDEAASQLIRAIEVNPAYVEALYNLGNVALAGGAADEAVRRYEEALQVDPDQVEVHNNLGMALRKTGDRERAMFHFRTALRHRPQYHVARRNLGAACLEAGMFEESLGCYVTILRAHTDDAEAQIGAGKACQALGRIEEAMEYFGNAIRLRPESPHAYHCLGTVMVAAGKVDQALDRFQTALRLQPDYAEVYNSLGNLLKNQGHPAESIHYYRKAIEMKPELAVAYVNLGGVLLDQGKAREALPVLLDGQRLAPELPGSHFAVGNAYRTLRQYEESLPPYTEAVRRDPSFAEAYLNLASTQVELSMFAEGIESYDGAIAARPGYADAHLNRSMVMLVLGRFEEGWREYEWRFRMKDGSRSFARRVFSQPRWDGSPLEGRTILIHTEQGFGDTLQFVRYVPLIKAAGGKVVFECPRELLGLMRTVPGIDHLVEKQPEIPLIPFDVQIPLLSLGHVFHTDEKSIPGGVPYIRADEDLVRLWRGEIPRDKLAVGLVWAGNPSHKNDLNRSLRLAELAPLMDIPGVRIVSLQKGEQAGQIARGPGADRVTEVGIRLKDFSDTAAVIRNLDLVITVDTSVAHLAGAMGVPVWTLLPASPDWRWLLGRSDSPWYPTMKLFRQAVRGDWGPVVAAVTRALTSLSNGRKESAHDR